jgi:hypothetical protein
MSFLHFLSSLENFSFLLSGRLEFQCEGREILLPLVRVISHVPEDPKTTVSA